MIRHATDLRCLLPGLLILLLAAPALAQSPATRQAVRATEQMLAGGDIDAFIESHLDDGYRASMTEDALRAHLARLQDAVEGATTVDLNRQGAFIHLIFGGADATVTLRLDDAGKISEIGLLEGGGEAADPRAEAAQRAMAALQTLARAPDDDALRAFADDYLDPALRAALGEAALLDQLRTIKRASAMAGMIMAGEAPGGEGYVLRLRGNTSADITFDLAETAPFRLTMLDVETENLTNMRPEITLPPVTWDNLEAWLAAEAEAGFSGTILIVREGEVVLHESYGSADPETGRAITPETIFGIGSNAIDFTRAAILMLADAGRLDLDDPITTFFDDVPADRAAMTIRHLMTGRSGLPNFHHDPVTDRDFDLDAISRDEALRRLMTAPLLFAPGTDEAHSHSAFTLLAAVIEEVSGQAYPDFIRSEILRPLGLTHTGFYGTDDGFREEQMAVAQGRHQVGPVNMALHWGAPTWLMMGSGGMVSTPADLHRFLVALYDGTLLSEAAQHVYGRGDHLSGGSDRGYRADYISDPDDTVILTTNRFGPHGGAVARALVGLVRQ